MSKNLYGGAIINSGPDLPVDAGAPLGTLFIKTGVDTGLYSLGFIQDASPATFGNQAQQQWQLVIDLTRTKFVERSGDTMSGQLQISTGTAPELHLTSVSPSIRFTETDQSTNSKEWLMVADGNTFQMQTRSDAFAFTSTPFDITRVGVARILGNTVWHAGNDGDGSGLDADKLDGLDSDILPTVSTLARRDTLGNIAAVRFEQTSASNENPVVSQVMVTSIDDMLRKSSISSFATNVQGVASGSWSITAANATNAVSATNATNATNAVSATNATNATFVTTVTVMADSAAATSRNVLFASGSSGTQGVKASSNLTYNPSTGNMATSITGNAASMTKLKTARTINGQSFDGSGNINIPGLGLTIISSQVSTIGYTNIIEGLSRASNYVDIFPPSGKSMANLVAFLPSTRTIYFAGDVNDDDILACYWEQYANPNEAISRIRAWCQNSEQRATPTLNYIAVWS